MPVLGRLASGMPDQPWRRQFKIASFRGVAFHMDSLSRQSGRRNVTHEYPKRDEPYTEDMGRHARRWQVTAYLIGPTYLVQKLRLIEAFESYGPGTFVHPFDGEFSVNVNGYSVHETREHGGYCRIEVGFVESGIPGNSLASPDTQEVVKAAAAVLTSVASKQFNVTIGVQV